MKRIGLIFISILFVFSGTKLSAQSEIPLKFRKFTKVDSGFINTYIIKDKVYFEIPSNIIGRDLLIASRISKISDTKNRSKLVAGQMLKNPVLVRFACDNNFVFLQKPNVDKIIDGNDALFDSFKKNNVVPVITAFKIEGKTSNSLFIDVTNFFINDLPYVSPVGDKARPGKLNSKLTKLLSVGAFDRNIEIRTRNYYSARKAPFIVEMQKSLVLLPEVPMKPRICDNRMNYFSSKKEIFSTKNQEVQSVSYAHRFDIQPRKEDVARYRNGELVEPEKPIVFYVDTTMPAKWKEAVKIGIEYWNIAFEKIGFKNTVVAKDYPNNDPEFDSDDIRYNCFKYVATERANAMGNHWVDPRTGEIIQADILWFDNVRKLFHKWRFLQTGAVDPAVRKKVLDDKIMCEMISYSAAHEVGHCLGQVHNMRSSYAYPTDSLRSATFTQKYGTTPSIMDYARFNYIAQPGDKDLELLPPKVGVYDIFSVKLAYKPVFDVKDEFEENKIIRRWIQEKENDPMYIFNRQSGRGIASDPSRQMVALGDDAVKSSGYGIKNLKYILSHLKDWMYEEGGNYDYLRELYKNIFSENFRYITHTIAYIGGVYEFDTNGTSNFALCIPVKKEKSIEAIDFIFTEMFTQSEWLNNEYTRSFAGSRQKDLSEAQRKIFKDLFSTGIFSRMYDYRNNEETLGMREYLDLLTEKIFTANSDEYRRAIQLFYINMLKAYSNKEYKDDEDLFYLELRLASTSELKNIKKKVKRTVKDIEYSEYLYNLLD